MRARGIVSSPRSDERGDGAPQGARVFLAPLVFEGRVAANQAWPPRLVGAPSRRLWAPGPRFLGRGVGRLSLLRAVPVQRAPRRPVRRSRSRNSHREFRRSGQRLFLSSAACFPEIPSEFRGRSAVPVGRGPGASRGDGPVAIGAGAAPLPHGRTGSGSWPSVRGEMLNIVLSAVPVNPFFGDPRQSRSRFDCGSWVPAFLPR